jgi:hypothetical protein
MVRFVFAIRFTSNMNAPQRKDKAGVCEVVVRGYELFVG